MRQSKIPWTPLLQIGVGLILKRYGITSGVLVTDDTDHQRSKKTPKLYKTHKIKDKIDLLHDTSFETKMQGIKAWQASEPNRLYLDLLRQSLDGRPVPDLIAEREAAKQPTLNKDEFAAILELNRGLRFG